MAKTIGLTFPKGEGKKPVKAESSKGEGKDGK